MTSLAALIWMCWSFFTFKTIISAVNYTSIKMTANKALSFHLMSIVDERLMERENLTNTLTNLVRISSKHVNCFVSMLFYKLWTLNNLCSIPDVLFGVPWMKKYHLRKSKRVFSYAITFALHEYNHRSNVESLLFAHS